MQHIIDSVTAVEEATIEVIKKETADLAYQEAMEEAERSARRVKMTEQQKREYALYRKACRFAGVWPTRADFLAGDFPSCVTREMKWLQNPLSKMSLEEVVILKHEEAKQLAMGAAVGR